MNFFDLHADTLTLAHKHNCDFNSPELAVSNQGAAGFNKYYQNFAVFTEQSDDRAWEYFESVVSYAADILPNFKGEYILSAENLSCLGQRLDRIEKLWYYGVKTASLTWNYANQIAGGALSADGLTPFGESVVAELNHYKIAVDLSHLNRKSFYNVIEKANVCLATHTALGEAKPHPRNIDLTQAKLIAEKGGIIGLCFYPEFLGEDVFECILKNVYLLLESVGEHHIAIGSDFDGARMHPRLHNLAQTENLCKYMVQNGIPKRTTENIFFNNAYNFFKGNGLI